MGFIRDFFEKINEILSVYMEPFLMKISEFLSSGEYLIYAIIGLFLILLIIVGLIRWLRKAPKLFITLVVIFGLVIGAWLISK